MPSLREVLPSLDPHHRAITELLAACPEGLFQSDLAARAAAYLGLRQALPTWREPAYLAPLVKAGLLTQRWNRWRLRRELHAPMLEHLLETERFERLAHTFKADAAWHFPDGPFPRDQALIQLRLRALLGQHHPALDLHRRLVDERGPGPYPELFGTFLDPRCPGVWEALDPQVRRLAGYEAWLLAVQDLGRGQARIAAILAMGDPEVTTFLEPHFALLEGDRPRARAALGRLQSVGTAKTLKGWLDLLDGRAPQALTAFDARLVEERKERHRRRCGLFGLGGLLHALAILKAAPSRREEAATWLAGQSAVRDPLMGAAHRLAQILEIPPRAPHRLEDLAADLTQQGGTPLECLLVGAAFAWDHHALPPALEAHLRQLREDLPPAAWGRPELDLILEPAAPSAPGLGLARWIQPTPAWELALEALEALTRPEAPAQERPRRLAWILTLDADGDLCGVEPRDQKRGPRGWAKGQLPKVSRAFSPEDDSWLQSQDYRALDAWRDLMESGPFPLPTQDDYAAVVTRLAGHPFVFREGPGLKEPRAVQVELGNPALRMEEGTGGRMLRLHPAPPISGACRIDLQEDRLRVIRFQPAQRRAAALLGAGVAIPPEATPRLEALLPRLVRHFPVQGDTPLQGTAAEALEGDATLHLILQPAGRGLRVSARTRPIPGGPWLRPGEGGPTVVAGVEGRLLQAGRDLADERARLDALLEICPALAEGGEGLDEFHVPEPAQALELLEAVDVLRDRVQAHWPEGAVLKLAGRIGGQGFRVSAKGGGGWLEASGELRLDDGKTLSLAELLRLVEGQTGRFVELGEGRFLALTAAFRKRLGDLSAFGEAHGKSWRLPALAAPLVGEELEGDEGFHGLIARYREAFAVQAPAPKGLVAELRPYQLEGFQWLVRMAAWEAGAVLADDMGLGKTVMTLALLLHRAAARSGGGPALVVAPTSVMANWETEAARFAPSLKLHRYHDADRAGLLRKLGKRDVVLTSYGLLQRDAEAFAGVEWNTLVLDEAQALKNAQAKRSQAAADLKATFRLALTGTPLENHLGELWSLFRVLNPGLLGSRDRFQRRFAGPIERDKDKEALHRLQRLVRPFLLRRTKAEVLEDLPERTEILREVELSREEATLYEALRRQALEDFADAAKQPPGQRSVKMLAQLMKLRRACCHPSLAMPGWSGPASKLEAFQELAEELREGGHRTLVFSQFVDHLHLVRDWMEAEGIPFQYLDGSTPTRARAQAVNAFQEGEGDFFLISLTAGGTGLNLTAADYVIILDPWWNPAVEDQASSRAHRMGQLRPVTVYRLVAKGTLEARIVKLHHQKRELAESILTAGEGGTRLSPEALLALLTEDPD
ncbi:MAG TPA: DEAD/DEAH box helicase [Holophagaceae bacterium]|nr:DEAD/DEAH box helicase [Holophagaceae bacterium]